MAENIHIDLDAANPLAPPEVDTKQVEEKDVVFVAHKDCELSINGIVYKFPARVPKKVTRDQARILIEAESGYLKD